MGGSCKASGIIFLVSNLRNLHGTTQVNRNIVPGFYRYLQAQDPAKQIEFADELKVEVSASFFFPFRFPPIEWSNENQDPV